MSWDLASGHTGYHQPQGGSDVLPGIPDAVERQTGKTPQQIVDEAAAAGLGPDTKAREVTTWLKTMYGIGHGHANR